jgi:hypothetical protein
MTTPEQMQQAAFRAREVTDAAIVGYAIKTLHVIEAQMRAATAFGEASPERVAHAVQIYCAHLIAAAG